MNPLAVAGIVGLLALGQDVAATETSIPADDAAAFGAQETAFSAALSADGKRMVYVGPDEGMSTIVVVVELATGTFRKIARADGNPMSFTSCDWSAADRLVCSLYGLERIQAVLTPEYRTIAMDADGGHQLALGEKDTLLQLNIRQVDGIVVDWLDGVDGAVLMARTTVPEKSVGRLIARTEQGLGVVRIDTRNGKLALVERPANDATKYYSDGQGNIRLMTTTKSSETGLLRGEDHHFYRLPNERLWHELGKYIYDGDGRGRGIQPLAVDPVVNAAYVRQRLDGRWALYRISLDGSMKAELAFASAEVDVADVVQVGHAGRVIGAHYVDDISRIEYFDATYKAIAATVARALPNLPLIYFESVSADEQVLLIRAASDVDPGHWYVFDRSKKTLGEVIDDRPTLKDRKLAPVKAVTYAAADGTRIPGYLTLPPGVSDAKNLPAVVLPHGGPAARAEWGFDWLAQFYAQRGYAVLQPNFRGSDGFGEAWYMNNGFQSWRTSIGDVCDGGRWLVKEGIADPAKLAIVGWSYGGYAALQANVLDPDLFKAVVAVAPVTDLSLLKSKAYLYTSSVLKRDFVGTGPHVTEGSPAQNVKAFKAPVLIFQGDKDLNVDIAQARRMDKELRSAGKSSELVVYPKLDHQLRDNDARADLLRKSEAFLRAQLNL